MTNVEKMTLSISLVSSLTSILSLMVTIVIYKVTSISARRMHSMELFEIWKNVNEITPNKLITVDIINALHAVEFTAIYYKYKILDRKILIELYRDIYVKMYDILIGMDIVIPGTNTNCKSSINKTMKEVYRELTNRG